MGRFIKIALALFLIGVGIIAIVIAVSDENPFNMDDAQYSKVELAFAEDEFNSFDLNFENRDFFIRESQDDQIKLEYYVSDKETILVTEGENELEINHKIEWINQIFTWFNYFQDDNYYDVYIYLPTTVEYDLDLDTSNGVLDILNLDNIGDLLFDSSNGRINLDNVEAEMINVSTSNGRIDLSGVIVARSITLKTSNGRINLDDVVAGTDVFADTSNGSVNVTNINAQDIKLDTSNGNIDVALTGDKDDYKLIVDTSNGDIDYDGLGITGGVVNDTGIYELDLDTSNGNITITFTD